MKSPDPLLPRRSSLYNECVRVLKARITAGEWADYLPGERRLAEILNVGRDTIRMALAELQDEGWIDSGSTGRQRQILKRLPSTKSRPNKTWRIGMLSPVPLTRLTQSMLTEVDQVRSILAQRGGVLDLIAPTWYDAPDVQKKLTNLLQTEPRDAWILYRSPKPVQLGFQSMRTPCLIRGYPHPGVNLPYMDYDWTAIGRHAVAELWRKGHRRIGLVLPRDGLRGNTAAWQGAISFNEPGITLTEIWEDSTKDGLVSALSTALQTRFPPTAFITLRPRQTITLLSWLGSRGFRIPEDFSLISLATEPAMEHLVPTVTTYQMDPSFFAKRVARQLELLVNGGGTASGSLLVMPDLTPGGSISAR